MPDSFTVKVEGLAELERNLNALPEKLAKGALRTATRKAGNILQKHARANVRASFVKRTGKLEKGIIVATTFKADGLRGGTVFGWIGLRIKPKDMSAYYGKFLEFGWVVGARVRASVARRRGGERGGHKTLARPFLAPAFEAEKHAMLDEFVKALRAAIDKVTFHKIAA